MVHTLPDYTSKYKNLTISNVTDFAENAARLGSIVSYDRRGNVVLLDDFEGAVLHWNTAIRGVGAGITLSTINQKSGDQSAKLVTGAAINDYASLYRRMPVPVIKRLGFEISLIPEEDVDSTSIYGEIYTGTRRLVPEMRLDTVNDNLEYRNNVDAHTRIDDIDLLDAADECWLTMKMVIDYETEEYVRFILNNTEYDLTGTALRATNNGTAPHMYISIASWKVALVNTTTYVDNFVLTQNEV